MILQQDITEFTPYVFQLMGQLLSFNTRPELPLSYQQMLPPLVQPVLWSQQGKFHITVYSHIHFQIALSNINPLLLNDMLLSGNIPALVKLLQAYLKSGASWIVANNQLEPMLGVFQKLVSSKLNDHHAFELLQAIITYIPM